ncbi:MAG TPA: hypothetical protein VGB51_05930 [Actinomycetota bacterium]
MVAVIAILLAPVGSAIAAPEHCSDQEAPILEPVGLCDRLELEGSQTGYVRVNAPQGFTLGSGAEQGATVRLEGSGTVGFVLTEDPPGPGGYQAFRLKYPPELAGSSPQSAWGCIPSCQLEPGNYRVYLITSGTLGKVTLEFGGQFDGAAKVPVMHFPSSETKLLPARLPAVPGRPVNSAGETRVMTSRGLIFSAIAAFHPNHLGSVVGRCIYYGDPGDPTIAYLPGCPSTSAYLVSHGTYPDATVSLGPFATRVEGIATVLPDTYGAGTWYLAGSTDTTAASLIVWLTFD